MLPAPTEMERLGRVGSEDRKVSAAQVCFCAQKPELQGPHFWWSRWSSFMQTYIYIFESSLTLDLSWQRILSALAWFASTLELHEHLVSMHCAMFTENTVPRFWLQEHVITHPTGFSTNKQAIFSLLFSPKVLLFSYRKSRFYDKALTSSWRQPLSQLCNTE